MKVTLIFCFLTIVLVQNSLASVSIEYSDPIFLKTINNFFGCKTWNDDICVQCSDHYFFNAKGICCSVQPECKNFNRQVGICEACYQGYSIINGECTAVNLTVTDKIGCKSWSKGKCLACSARWYFDAGQCKPVSDLCRTWTVAGICRQCYRGYIVSNQQCVPDPNQPSPLADNLCSIRNQSICLKCADRAYFDKNRVCRSVSDQCATWDQFDGLCLTCYNGYNLTNGECIITPSVQIANQGCRLWNEYKQTCIICSQRWYFNQKKVCLPVSDACSKWNSSGACTDCYKGYEVVNGNCVLSSAWQVTDQGCRTWDWEKRICLSCSKRYYFNQSGSCAPVADSCSDFTTTGICTACFKGYNLVNGVCIQSSAQPMDLGCNKWDYDRKFCYECSRKWAFNSRGVCVPVSDLCSKWNTEGVCTLCYKGYDLVNGTCLLSQIQSPIQLDGCRAWKNSERKVCIQCSKMWAFNSQGVCVPVSDLCSKWSTSGFCTACYKGYDAVNGTCVLAQVQQVSDIGCRKWNLETKVCVQCSTMWAFNSKGICVPVSELCRTWDTSGFCTTCYNGYVVANGNCVLSSSQVTDIGCSKWNQSRLKCIECSVKWTFSLSGFCVPVSDLCRQWNSTGACVTCYDGYEVRNGCCFLALPDQVSDPGCKTWNSKKICLQCSAKWTFNSMGVCMPVPDNCKQWNSSGVCLLCYSGYEVSNGKCQIFNTLCKTLDKNGVCLSCFSGYILYQKNCIPLSKIADLTLYYSECCPQKLQQLQNAGRI